LAYVFIVFLNHTMPATATAIAAKTAAGLMYCSTEELEMNSTKKAAITANVPTMYLLMFNFNQPQTV
jgi:hypothetical protein